MSADKAPAAHGTEAQMGGLERQKDPVLSAPPRVGDEEVAYTPADAACGSNPSRGWVQTRRPMDATRSEEHTSELQSHLNLVCPLLLEKKKPPHPQPTSTIA